MNKIALILGLMCFLATTLICIQIKTVKDMTKEVGTTLEDNTELKEQLINWQSAYSNLRKRYEQAETDLEKVRTKSTKGNQSDKETELQIKNNNALLGLTEVKGSGVIIKLDDNRNVDPTEVLNISTYLVHEEDILQIVNELFNAGADAISIDGQRIVSTTSILCDGNIIRINGEKIGVPMTISAIGYPETLYYALMRPQGYLDIMIRDGVMVNIDTAENIIIPKYDGVYSYEYINNNAK